jgi:hypothetical protein
LFSCLNGEAGSVADFEVTAKSSSTRPLGEAADRRGLGQIDMLMSRLRSGVNVRNSPASDEALRRPTVAGGGETPSPAAGFIKKTGSANMAAERRGLKVNPEGIAPAIIVPVWTLMVLATGLADHPYVATAFSVAGMVIGLAVLARG